MFPYEFCDISKNTNFTEHLWTAAPTQTPPVDPLETVKQLSNKYNYNESNTLPKYVFEFTRSKDSLELHSWIIMGIYIYIYIYIYM